MKTELVKIVKNRTVTPAARPPTVNYNNNVSSSTARNGMNSGYSNSSASNNIATSRTTASFIMSGVSFSLKQCFRIRDILDGSVILDMYGAQAYESESCSFRY